MHMIQRRNSGSSLVTVMGIGIISTLWISALMGVVMPSYQKASQSRIDIALRASAEAALDWAVSQLNIAGSSIDDASNNGAPGPNINVPSDVLGQYGTSTKATISVNNVMPQGTSALYDPGLDPANASSNGGVTANGWRVVTATATSGKVSRSVRIVLKPSYSAVPTFDYGLFGRSSLNINGNATTDSYDSSAGSYGDTHATTGGNVGTNTRANLNGQTVIGGDLNVLSSPPGSTNVVVSGTGSPHIVGRLTANGTIRQGYSSPDFTSANVDGKLLDGSVAATPIATQQTNVQKQLPQVPPAPTGAVDLGAIKLSGNRTLELHAPGDYIANKLQISGNAKIVISGQGPVRLFVRGATASVGISGNGIVNNGRPQDLQIYYNGSANTSISGNGTFSGILYAPNSAVRLVGNSAVFGSIAGNSINVVGNGAFHYDRSLASLNNSIMLTLSRMQTVSWQEL